MPTPISITIIVPSVDKVLETFNVVKVYRSVTSKDGPYVEITDAGTRVVLDPNKTAYEYTDQAGEPTYYYRLSYFNTNTLQESSQSDPQLGEGDTALDIISVEELKTNYLFGLDLTNDAGTAYPDSLYEFYIKSAVSRVERELDLYLTPTAITDYAEDYIINEYYDYITIKLLAFPVIAVDEVIFRLPGGVNQQVINYPPEWFELEKEIGQLNIVPGNGSSTLLFGAAPGWLPYVQGWNRFIPRAFQCSYTAGFEKGKVPPEIVDLVGKFASFGPLNIAGDLLGGAGIASQSISLDGLSQSFNTTSSSTSSGYGSRLLQYTREIKDTVPKLRAYYKGVRLWVA